MRVLFSSVPLHGHLHPLLPVARALGASGHEIAFAVSAEFAPVVERFGFRHFAAGFAGDFIAAHPDIPPIQGPERLAYIQSQIFGSFLTTRMLPDLVAIAAEWRPDLFVREDREYASCIAGELLGLPHAVVGINAAGNIMRDERVREPLNDVRASCGLAPDPGLTMVYRYLRLSPFPPSLADPRFSVPPTTHFVQISPEDRSGPEDLPAWVSDLPKVRPIVYVGLGTVHNLPELFRTVIEGLRDEPLTLIVTVGRNLDPGDFGEQPEHVHIERYIPLSRLLPHCDAAIINAGSGTLSATLRHGLPLVVIPVGADQPLNAQRCAALDVGIALDVAQVTPERVRLATRAILSEPRYRECAGRLRAEIEVLPGVEHAVALLEQLGRGRQPLVRER
jgi:UDP:flavonoid glycosyltransferase YjiC (YdhE family)